MSERKHSFNVKFGTGYEAPLLSIGYDTLAELEGELRAIHGNQQIIDMMVAVATTAQGKYRAVRPDPVQAPQNNQQAASQSAPQADDVPKCLCGKYLEKKPNKDGDKLYWRCTDWRWNNGSPNDDEHDSYQVGQKPRRK